MTELSKNLVCILMRSGVEIWVEADRAESLKKQIEGTTSSMFVRYENQFINTADISGIFTAPLMEDRTRRKNGDYKCNFNKWHSRQTKCTCAEEEAFDRAAKATDEMLKSRKIEPQS
jgi:hypothetical protein